MTKKSVDERLHEQIKYAYENAPAVRARLDKAGVTPDDIRGVADLPKIPILPKDHVIALQQSEPPLGGMLAVPLQEVSHIFLSPGPIYEPAPTPDDSAWETAVSVLEQIGFEPGDVVLNSFSYHLVPAGFLFDEAFRRLGCITLPGGAGQAELQLKMAVDLGATGYVGTPSFLMTLARKVEEQGLIFGEQFQINKALVSAEPLPPGLRAALEERGIVVGNAYATADLGLVALNVGEGMIMDLLEEPIIEVVDPDTGQPVDSGATGEVVATNFSRVYPLIRLGTGDMAVNMDPNPGQTKQTERGIVLVGRSGEAAKVRGMFVHPNQLGFAARQVEGIGRVQGVVRRPEDKDYFLLRAERVADVGEGETAESLKTAVRNICRVRVDEVEFVAAGAIAEDAPGMVDERDWQA